MGKTERIPVAIVRGLDVEGHGSAKDLVMSPEHDLFR
jgi:F420-0:gamma-glutamyl ligase